MMTAPSKEIQNFEVETQFFGFNPLTIVDLAINAVNDIAFDRAEELRKRLLLHHSNLDEDELLQTLNAVLNYVQDSIDKYFDKFELYCLTEVFRIPAHISLPGDLPKQSPTDAHVEALDQERLALRKRIASAQHLNSLLRTQEAALQRNLESWHRMAENKTQIRQIYTTTQVQSVLEHIQSLGGKVALLAEMREKIASLKRSPTSDNVDTLTQDYKRHRNEVTTSSLAAVHDMARSSSLP